MNLVSVIIPYATYHTSIVDQAIAAAKSQSLPCEVIPVHDTDSRGAGCTRNRGVALSNSLFVVFCDADDVLREDAIERLVSSYQRGHYVYCDNIQGDSLHQTPDRCGYVDGSWHVVTSLIPTNAFKFVGGFDESLPALEDKDLFLRLQAHGCCGVRCPYPLLKYTAGGKRSLDFNKDPNHNLLYDQIENLWSGAAKMGCNCGTPVSGIVPDGKQDGDILVQALYTPMQKVGKMTGRLYPRPRGASNYQLYVDPRDVDASPNLWQPVKTIDINAAPDVETVVRLAAEAMGQ